MKSLSIKVKILLTALFLIGASFFFQTQLIAPYITKLEIKDALQYQQTYNKQLASSFDFTFRQAMAELEAMAARPYIISMDKEKLDHALQQFDQITQFFNYHFVLDTSGTFVSYPSRPQMVGRTIPAYNMKWVNECVHAKKTIFLDVVAAQIGTLVSGIATPIFNEAGQVTGVLRGVVVVSDNNTVLSTIEGSQVGNRGYTFVVASNGLLIAHPEFTKTQKNMAVYDAKHLAPVQKVIAGESGSIEYNDEGETWLATYFPIPSNGWGVISQQPKIDIVSHAKQKASFYLAMTTLFSLLVLLALLAMVHYAIAPLLGLLEAIKTGNLQKETPYPKDEIGEIAREFNSLYSELLTANEQLKQEISERIRTQDELKAAKKEADFANAAKSTFLANMSHEIRTPLNGIMGMTDLVLGTKLNDDQKKYLDIVQKSSKRLLHVLSDILDFSRMEANKFTLSYSSFNIRELLEEIAQPFSLQTREKGIALQISVSDDIPTLLHNDPNRLAQVLINLLSNAVKFTEEGEITLHASLQASDSESISIRFSVADSGIGVPADKQQSIFKSFHQIEQTLTKRHAGTGLGLAISAQLVALMGGKIWIESPANQDIEANRKRPGSVFHCLIPFSTKEVSASATQPDPQSQPPAPGPPHLPIAECQVMIAEDEPINLLLITHLLQDYGLTRITEVTNGNEAVSAYKKNAFDLILMDVQMPDMDGRTATREIRRLEEGTGRTVPIIALTAFAMEEDRARSIEAGMTDFLAKPIDSPTLFALLHKYLQ